MLVRNAYDIGIDGNANGKGKCIMNNGDIYEGEFKNNRANGCGIHTQANGNIYEGYFKDDL